MYVDVAGQQVWHEVSGDGPAVVLLHGAFSGATGLAGQTPAFAAAGYRVHVPERRGHAHTPDVDGPLTYQVMADDTVAYLEQETGRAHLVGWSDGAVVALLVAMQRPDLVDRMVLIGQYYSSAGKPPSFSMIDLLDDEEVKGYLRQGYDPYSPDGPDHFDVVHAKTMHMIRTEPEIAFADIAGVEAPTLVLVGDRDEVTLTHSQQVADTLPEGRLAVLPGTHLLPIESPDSVNTVVLAWLARPAHPEEETMPAPQGPDLEAVEARRAALREEHLLPASSRPASTARGLHHTALISSDVEATIAFYQGVLGFPLTELIENRDYPGSSHFFFDLGNSNLLAFFDFPGLDVGPYAEVLGGLHHCAISVDPAHWEALVAKLDAAGVEHEVHSGVSVYFRDPDGARIELIADPLGEMYGEHVL